MTKMKMFAAALLFAGAAAGLGATLSARTPAAARITGDYVEARTASVFAGPCHYNGELDTTGRDAVMAWNITGGSYDGVDLRGLRTVAAVSCDQSLGNQTAARRSELAVDPSATNRQVAAFAALLKTRCGTQLGRIAAVRRAPIAFTRGGSGYTVTAAGFAEMYVNYRADNSCCIQPNLVWFDPLSPIENRKVGYTEFASYTGKVADHWTRSGEDGAFYGAIAF